MRFPFGPPLATLLHQPKLRSVVKMLGIKNHSTWRLNSCQAQFTSSQDARRQSLPVQSVASCYCLEWSPSTREEACGCSKFPTIPTLRIFAVYHVNIFNNFCIPHCDWRIFMVVLLEHIPNIIQKDILCHYS